MRLALASEIGCDRLPFAMKVGTRESCLCSRLEQHEQVFDADWATVARVHGLHGNGG
jgi:hypothetical protein